LRSWWSLAQCAVVAKMILLKETAAIDLCTLRTAARWMLVLHYHLCGAVQVCMSGSLILRFKKWSSIKQKAASNLQQLWEQSRICWCGCLYWSHRSGGVTQKAKPHLNQLPAISTAPCGLVPHLCMYGRTLRAHSSSAFQGPTSARRWHCEVIQSTGGKQDPNPTNRVLKIQGARFLYCIYITR